MLGMYKYSRDIIVNYIKQSPITKDGNYYCPKFKEMNEARGLNDDKKYFFPRNLFNDKICFNQAEIEAYLEEYECDYNIEEMIKKDNMLKEIIGDLTHITDLNEILPNELYTLGELIDTALFMFYSKY